LHVLSQQIVVYFVSILLFPKHFIAEKMQIQWFLPDFNWKSFTLSWS